MQLILISPVNLSHIHLILRAAGRILEGREKFSLLNNGMEIVLFA